MSGMASVAVLLATLGGTPDGVVLDFSAAWCGPCQSMVPIVDRLKTQGYAIQKVDFDRNRRLAASYGVTHLPTFLLVVDGKVRQRFVGPMSERDLRRMASAIPKKSANAKTGVRQSTADRMGLSPSGRMPATGVRRKTQPPQAGPPKAVIRANDDTEDLKAQEQNPIAVCARIRVRQGDTINMGTGTIIQSEPGKTLILTCGHIFRGFKESGTVEVDLFNRATPQTYDAKLVKADLDADVGLISLHEVARFPVASIAKRSAQRGNHVYSIGCGGGDAPSRLQHLVTSTDRYQPDFVECTGMPVQGRSGGGLFTTDGDVVGVCLLAEPESRRGLYTSLRTIHRLLDRCGLENLAPQPDLARLDFADQSPVDETPRFVGDEAPRAGSPISGPTSSQLGAATGSRKSTQRFVPRFGVVRDFAEDDDTERVLESTLHAFAVDEDDSSIALETTPRFGQRAGRLQSESALLDALAAAQGAEVICVIRGKEGEKRRIVIINEASEKFIRDLANELTNQAKPTTITVKRHSFLQTAPFVETSALRETRAVNKKRDLSSVAVSNGDSTDPLRYRRSSRSRMIVR